MLERLQWIHEKEIWIYHFCCYYPTISQQSMDPMVIESSNLATRNS